jgi:hypothetical protein
LTIGAAMMGRLNGSRGSCLIRSGFGDVVPAIIACVRLLGVLDLSWVHANWRLLLAPRSPSIDPVKMIRPILGYVFTIRRRTALFAYQRLTP